MSAPDERAELARTYLAEVSGTSVEQLPPSVLMRECAELRRLLGQVLGILGEAVRDRDDLTEANDGLRATLKDLALRLAERQAEARRLAERAAAERSQLFTAIRHGISLDVPWRGEALDLIHHLFAEGDQP